MTTKKQKRQRLEEKRNQELANRLHTGLQAQKQDREERAKKLRGEWQNQHDKKHSWKKRIVECPLCQDEIQAAEYAAKKAKSEETI